MGPSPFQSFRRIPEDRLRAKRQAACKRVWRIINGQKTLVTLCPPATADGAMFYRQAPMRSYIQSGD